MMPYLTTVVVTVASPLGRVTVQVTVSATSMSSESTVLAYLDDLGTKPVCVGQNMSFPLCSEIMRLIKYKKGSQV